MLEDHELFEILATGRPPSEQVDTLVAEANRRGGLDNITVVLVRIDSVGTPSGEHAAVASTEA